MTEQRERKEGCVRCGSPFYNDEDGCAACGFPFEERSPEPGLDSENYARTVTGELIGPYNSVEECDSELAIANAEAGVMCPNCGERVVPTERVIAGITYYNCPRQDCDFSTWECSDFND